MNMMNLRFSVAYMLIIGGLTQYYVMPNVMLNDVANIRNSLGKFYLAGVMAFIMAILEVIMFDIHNKTITISYYIPLFACFVITLWLYRNQIAVNDVNYLREMIEHHDMALLTSKGILNKPDVSPKVRELAKKIIDTQTSEIIEMNELIKEEKLA